MKYAMLIRGDENEGAEVDSPTRDEGMKEVYAWFEKWGPTGKIADGGAELDATRTAKTIRPGATGPVVTDGPYLELKEVLGGVVFLNADSIDDAVAVAATWPLWGSSSIEVRPVIEH